MRCNGCNKFASYDTDSEPEVDVDVDEDGVVTGTVRIVNTCAECGEELKEANFDLEIDLSDACKDHDPREGNKHALEVDVADNTRTDRSASKKMVYGAHVEVKITCECGKLEASGEWTNEVQGSGMDELQ